MGAPPTLRDPKAGYTTENFYFFNYVFIDLRERDRREGREKGRERREKHGSATSCTPPSGDGARKLGMCP